MDREIEFMINEPESFLDCIECGFPTEVVSRYFHQGIECVVLCCVLGHKSKATAEWLMNQGVQYTPAAQIDSYRIQIFDGEKIPQSFLEMVKKLFMNPTFEEDSDGDS